MYSPEIEGLKKLRTANIIMIVAAVMALWLIPLPFIDLAFGLANVGTIAAMVVFGSTVGQVAMLMMMRGFGDLKSLYPKMEIGVTGSIILYEGLILFVVFFTIINIYFLVFIAYIVSFIGSVLLGVGFYRIGKTYGSSLVKVGGILLMFFPVIGVILNVIGLNGIIRRVGTDTQVGTYRNRMSVTIYQEGNATLSSDGTLSFSLFSSHPLQLVSAFIEGTNYVTTNLTPNTVQPNQTTNVKAVFSNIQVNPGNQYKVIITAIVNGAQVQFPILVRS